MTDLVFNNIIVEEECELIVESDSLTNQRMVKNKKIVYGKAWQEVIDVKLIHVNGPNFYL